MVLPGGIPGSPNLGTRGQETGEIGPGGGGSDLLDQRRNIGQFAAMMAVAAAIVHHRHEERIFRKDRRFFTGTSHYGKQHGPVGLQPPREVEAINYPPTAGLEGQLQGPLGNAGGLSDPGIIEAQISLILCAEVQVQCLIRSQFGKRRLRKRIEQSSALDSEPGFFTRGFGVHVPPPNISTPAKRQGGDPCPTRMAWLGSPLPQNGVP